MIPNIPPHFIINIYVELTLEYKFFLKILVCICCDDDVNKIIDYRFALNMDELDDDEEFDQLLCITASFIEYYYLTYIHKEPCMNSPQTGYYKWMVDVLEGNRSRCHNMFRMENDVFFRLYTSLQTMA